MSRLSPWLLVVVICAASCGMGDWSYDEVSRITSPSGKLDAVLVEGSGGATTSFGYSVYVVLKGKPVSEKLAAVADLYGAVRSEHAYGADLKWETNRLAIEYLGARWSTNPSPVVTVAGEQISITLWSNINNAAAPPGGMGHNLKRGRR